MWSIYDKSGTAVKATAHALEYNGTWMGECYVSATIKSPVPIDLAIGDYLVYRGERFEINQEPTALKKARRERVGDGFTYENVKFNALSDELTRCDFLDVVLEDNDIHFTSLPKFSFFAASVQDMADRIQANLDRLYRDEKAWTVEVHPEFADNTNVNIDAQNIKVWGALELCVKEFGAYFIVRGRHITIGTAGVETGHIFKFGQGNGLYEIQRQSEDNQGVVTRLRAYGNTTNMPHRYYNKLSNAQLENYLPNNMAVDRLMLPGFPETTLDPYIDSDNASAIGLREGTVFFDGSNELDDIYPSLEGMTADQLASAGIFVHLESGDNGNLDELLIGCAPADDGVFEEGDNVPDFTITIKDVGFDINDYLTSEDALIAMKSGMCGGREFTITKCQKTSAGYELTCQRVEDSGIGLYFPNRYYSLRQGDKFVLLHIEMPDAYIKAASQRLLEAATEYLAKNDYTRFSYSPKVDEIYMARQHDTAMASNGAIESIHDTIKEGNLLIFEDEDLGIDANIVIDSLIIKEGDSAIPKYEVTLRSEKTVGTIQKMQNQIDSLRSGKGAGVNTSQIKDIVKAVGREEFLSKKVDDTAIGRITFGAGTKHLGAAQFGSAFVGGMQGVGGRIDPQANAELESLRLRSWLEVPEIRFNRAEVILGDQWASAGGGIVERVQPDYDGSGNRLGTGVAWLKLEEGEIGAIAEGDICKGYFHDFGNPANNAAGDSTKEEESLGNKRMAGFATVFFRIEEVMSAEGGVNNVFRYAIRGVSERWPWQCHPYEGMHFVCYGSFTDAERQTSKYTTRTYERYLVGVSNWELGEANIAAQFGDLSNLSVFGLQMAGYSAYLNNIYMSGTIKQFENIPITLECESSTGDWVILWGEDVTLTCRVKRGWEDITDSVQAWTITRDTADPAEDAAWNASQKARDFDGTIVISNSKTPALNDLGHGTALSALFTITAVGAYGTQTMNIII